MQTLNATQKTKKTAAGRIPVDWEAVNLGEYLKEISIRNFPINTSLPVLSVTNTQGFVTSESYFDRKVYSKDLSNYKIIDKEQFAYNPSRINVGSIAQLKSFDKGCLSPMYVVFEAQNGLVADYLAYWIQSGRFKNLIDASTQGTVRDSVNFSSLAGFPFARPPVDEQKKIIIILSCVDDIISKTQAVIDQIQRLKKALMQELFTRGLPGRHKKFKKTKIGEIPEDWKLSKLIDVSSDGISNGIFRKRFQFGGGVLMVNVLDTYRGLFVDPSSLDRVEATSSEIERFGVVEGDLLFVRSSLKFEGVGQCCIVGSTPEPMLYECHLMKLRPNRELINPVFLAYYCNSPVFRGQMFSNAKIQTMTTLGQKDISEIIVPVPSREQQELIAKIFTFIEQEVEITKKIVERNLQFKSALMQVLLTGEVRVK